jgi:hypothetical protein
MLELGIDVAGSDASSRGFIRTGWNF